MNTLHTDRITHTQDVPRYSPEEVRNGLSLFKYISGNAVLVGDPDAGKSEAQLALQNPGSIVTSLAAQYEMLQLDKNAFSHAKAVPEENPVPFGFGVKPNNSPTDTFIGRYKPHPDDVYGEYTTSFLNALNIGYGSIVKFGFDFKPKSGLDGSRDSGDKLFEENTANFEVETPTAKFKIKFTGVLGSMSMKVLMEKPSTPEFSIGDTVMKGIVFNKQEDRVENTGTEMTLLQEIADSETLKTVTDIAFALVRNTQFEKHTIVAGDLGNQRAVR